MRTGPLRAAVLVLPLVLASAACGTEAEEPGGAGDSQKAAPPQPSQEAPRPESAEDFLDLAAKAMGAESAWSFSVEGEEGLTLQGRKSAASYEGTLRRAGEGPALHSRGVSTSSKGTERTEELYVVEDTGYVKEDGAAGWKAFSPTDPEMLNKIEDPVAVLEEFRSLARAAAGDVEVARKDDDGGGTVELRVRSGERTFGAVRDKAWAAKAKREFEPTGEQLRKAGVPVADDQLTLSGLEEVLVLDAGTYRVESHRLEFGFLIPYNGQDIVFEQRVSEENQGPYKGTIELPADVR